jgi:hypothetical protein
MASNISWGLRLGSMGAMGTKLALMSIVAPCRNSLPRYILIGKGFSPHSPHSPQARF